MVGSRSPQPKKKPWNYNSIVRPSNWSVSTTFPAYEKEKNLIIISEQQFSCLSNVTPREAWLFYSCFSGTIGFNISGVSRARLYQHHRHTTLLFRQRVVNEIVSAFGCPRSVPYRIFLRILMEMKIMNTNDCIQPNVTCIASMRSTHTLHFRFAGRCRPIM